MQGRENLDLAREYVTGGRERRWRGAARSAYYALFLECRDVLARWGFTLPARDTVHDAVRARFRVATNPDLPPIGGKLNDLMNLRIHADYRLNPAPHFRNAGRAQQAIQEAAAALVLLDAIDADPVRRNLAVAAIRAAFP
jgi:hypothetical protein